MISRIWSVEIQGRLRCAASAAAAVHLPTVGAPPIRYFVPFPIANNQPRADFPYESRQEWHRCRAAGNPPEPGPPAPVGSRERQEDAMQLPFNIDLDHIGGLIVVYGVNC